MKIFAAVLLCMVCGIAGFAQTISRQDTLLFYSTVTKQLKETAPKVQELWGKVQNAFMNASQKAPYKADPAVAADIKAASGYNINDLDRAMRNITLLTDVEPQSGLKEMVTGLFGELLSAERVGIPVLLTVLAEGTNKATPQQASTMKAFISKGRELRARLSQINNLLSQYASRNRITPEEMSKMGL